MSFFHQHVWRVVCVDHRAGLWKLEPFQGSERFAEKLMTPRTYVCYRCAKCGLLRSEDLIGDFDIHVEAVAND